jgi:hypothetical protein
VPKRQRDVRFRAKSGRQMLNTSFSAFDPKRTSAPKQLRATRIRFQITARRASERPNRELLPTLNLQAQPTAFRAPCDPGLRARSVGVAKFEIETFLHLCLAFRAIHIGGDHDDTPM